MTTHEKSPQKRPASFVVNGVLAGGVMYYALRLSASGRTTVDWVVIGLVTAAILYNVISLCRRLLHAVPPQGIGHVVRTLGLWAVGLMNTVALRPEDVGGWRQWVGIAVLVLAAADTVALYRRERRALVTDSPQAT